MKIPNKEELNKLYNKDLKTMKDIGKIFNVDRHIVNKWFLLYDIKTRCKIKCLRPEKEELIKLYDVASLNEIQKFYKVGKKAIKKWFNEYNIKIIPGSQKKFNHIRKIPLTQMQKEFIIGTLIGDGSISICYNGKLARLSIAHSEKQKDYLLWKKEIINNLVNKIYINKQTLRNSTLFYFVTISHQDLNYFYNLFYKDKIKIIKKELINYITPFSMAVWYMDDGSTKSKGFSMKLCTEGFTLNDNIILKNIIKIKFNIDCSIKKYKGKEKIYNYLSFNKKNSILLNNLIKPYFIDCMRYKLLKDDDIV